MSVVRVDIEPPARIVTLDDGKANVLTLEAVEALGAALRAEADTPVVVLRGRPGSFCAGLDNATLASGAAERDALLAAMGELLLGALESETRIVAVCEGHAVAAGAMLLLVADVRVGTAGPGKIGFTEPRMGMPLPGLPAELARGRLDRRRLHELTVLGGLVGPEEAAEVGFLDAIVEADALLDTALEHARALAALDAAAYRGSMRTVWGRTIERVRESVEAQVRRRERATNGGG